ncbi:hypothetical protein AOT82_1159 [Psychrobacter sp. AntiMn-1]|nr:hypothetical protein AOT82_1159 [Psychrobacter sp. AntiMn-1]
MTKIWNATTNNTIANNRRFMNLPKLVMRDIRVIKKVIS